MNLFFWSSFPEDCSDDGHFCEARALHAAAGDCVGDIELRNVPEVPALSQERDRLCLRHALVHHYLRCTTTLARPPNCSCLPPRCVQRPHSACNPWFTCDMLWILFHRVLNQPAQQRPELQEANNVKTVREFIIRFKIMHKRFIIPLHYKQLISFLVWLRIERPVCSVERAW